VNWTIKFVYLVLCECGKNLKLVGFCFYLVDAKNYQWVLSWWRKEKHKFLTIVTLE
jgi:hypothetical protein